MRPVLDRRVPPDWRHYERFPLMAAQVEALEPSPVVWGVDWHQGFDTPQRASDGRYWVGRDASLGVRRGGHAISSPASAHRDSVSWWDFYNQGSEGACVGFSVCRALTYLNRKRYDARELYLEAQKIDEWPGEAYSGSSVRAGLKVAMDRGPRPVKDGKPGPPSPRDGIQAYRWSNSVEDIIEVLGWDYGRQVGAVPWTNSWGRSYPRVVWVPGEVAQGLIDRDGECGVPVDR